jgi:cytoskeleton protein RodZ
VILVAAEPGGDVRAGIGTRLRSARERKGLTILQAAEKLHVDARILESLEAEDFAALGAPVYARGHLRHYAELIGEPPAELQELYSNSTRAVQAQPDLTRISRVRPTSDPGKLVVPAVIVLGGIGLIGTVWWILTLSRTKPQPPQLQGQVQGNPASQPATADAAASPPSAGAIAVNSDATLPVPVKRPDTAVGAPRTGAKSPVPVPVPTKQTAPAVPGTATPPPHGKDAELTLKFSADSWAEVYDASGQRLFYDVGAASSAHTVKGVPPLRIVLGNAAGVAVELNGHPASITNSVLPDGSAQFSINARGRAVRAKPGADGG